MHTKTLQELSEGLKNKTFSSLELTAHYLDRITTYNSHTNAYISVTEDIAKAQALAADKQLQSGNAGVLTGIPLAHKDIFCTQDIRTSCGSKMLDNFIAPYNATVVEQLNAAGTVTLGKLNMDEFAMGSSNETSFYGAVKNPWSADCVPGGSSGGSAAAVAAGLSPMATATDTGGSIRQPAALCGLTGLKPTYGRCSRYGMIAFASSLDQAGTMTKTAYDSALMLQAMAGYDAKDSTSSKREVDDYIINIEKPLSGLRIGVPKEFMTAALNGDIASAVESAIAVYTKLGATIKTISLANSSAAVPVYYVVAPAEASANLSRYDGVRYGHRCESPVDLEDLYRRSRAEGFGEEVKRRILVGTYVLSAGYFDAYYRKAQAVRRMIKQDFDVAFNDVDLILGPTSPSPAFKIGEKTNDPLTMYLEDIYTIPSNLAGLPAMSIQGGFSQDLPIGLQLTGRHFDEATLLNAAHMFQQATDWHTQLSPMMES